MSTVIQRPVCQIEIDMSLLQFDCTKREYLPLFPGLKMFIGISLFFLLLVSFLFYILHYSGLLEFDLIYCQTEFSWLQVCKDAHQG